MIFVLEILLVLRLNFKLKKIVYLCFADIVFFSQEIALQTESSLIDPSMDLEQLLSTIGAVGNPVLSKQVLDKLLLAAAQAAANICQRSNQQQRVELDTHDAPVEAAAALAETGAETGAAQDQIGSCDSTPRKSNLSGRTKNSSDVKQLSVRFDPKQVPSQDARIGAHAQDPVTESSSSTSISTVSTSPPAVSRTPAELTSANGHRSKLNPAVPRSQSYSGRTGAHD